MTNTANKILLGSVKPVRQTTGMSSTGTASTSLFNTSSTWSVVNVADQSMYEGWMWYSGEESTPVNNIFTSYKNRGYTYSLYKVNNQTTNFPISGKPMPYGSGLPHYMYVYHCTNAGNVYNALNIYTSTHTLKASDAYIAKFVHQYDYKQWTYVLGQKYLQGNVSSYGNGYAVGKNAAGTGKVWTINGNTMTATSAWDNASNPYTCMAAHPTLRQVAGTSTGKLFFISGGFLVEITGVPGSGAITALKYTPSGRLLMARGTAGGNVYYSDNNGDTWTTVTPSDTANGLICATIDTTYGYNNYNTDFYYDPNSGYMITLGDKCTIWYSTDNGATWSRNTAITPTVCGNASFGYLRLFYHTGWDNWQGIVCAYQSGTKTAGLLRHTIDGFNPHL